MFSFLHLADDNDGSKSKNWTIYCLLMVVGGYLGAFTYSIRGGVFCNAQTGNFVLMAMALGNRHWNLALYYFIPITAYCAGALMSEAARRRLDGRRLFKWETLLIFVEMAVVGLLGVIPETAPVQITQVAVNFIASMQYNTFRQTQGIPVATTFCTNHIRQVGITVYDLISQKEDHRRLWKKLAVHLWMLVAFVIGGTVSAALCISFLGRSIWFAEIPLILAAIELLRNRQISL